MIAGKTNTTGALGKIKKQLGWTVTIGAALVGCAHGGPGTVEVPFEQHSHMIFVHARVGDGPPVRLNVDSGAPTLVLDPAIVDRLGLKPGTAQSTRGFSPGSTIERAPLPKTTVTLGGKTVKIPSPVTTSLAEPAALFGVHFDGVLGHQLFEQYIVELDYVRSVLALHEIDGFEYEGSGIEAPLQVTNRRGYLPIEIQPVEGPALSAKLVLDTGSMDGVTLGRPLSSSVSLARGEGDRIRGSGFGLGGMYDGVFGVLQPAIRIAGIEIDNVMLGMLPFQMDADGLIGAGVLHRFKVFFDYPGRRLLLEPNRRLHDPHLENRSGIGLQATGPELEQIVVAVVFVPSPGSEAGVVAGDRILAIDSVRVGDSDLEGAREALSSVGHHTVTVLRDDEEKQLPIECREWRLD